MASSTPTDAETERAEPSVWTGVIITVFGLCLFVAFALLWLAMVSAI